MTHDITLERSQRLEEPHHLVNRLAILLIGAICALAMVVGVTGCGQSPEEAVRQSITQRLDSLKGSGEQVVSQLSDSQLEGLESMGIDVVALYDALLAHFSYSIGNISVDGDAAEATIEVQNVDLQAVGQVVAGELQEWMTSSEAMEALVSGGQSAVVSKVMDVMIAAIEAPDAPVTSGTVDVSMARADDGSWNFTDSDEVEELLFAGQDVNALTSSLS